MWLTIVARLWWKVALHQLAVLGAGLQVTLLNAGTISIRRESSLTDSALQ